MNYKIIVALDGLKEFNDIQSITNKLKNNVDGYKITEAADKYGTKIVCYLKQFGLVMVDLKINDIPNTVKNRLTVWDQAKADLITLYAKPSNLKIAQETLNYSKVLAVKKLTSDHYNNSFNYKKVINMCKKYNTYGLVMGVNYLKRIKDLKGLKIATPGIRMNNQDINDQKVFASPKDAVNNGSNYLIIGRPIIHSENPLNSLLEIKKSIEN